MRLQEILNANVVTIGPDETADAAWAAMRRKRIRHLVVVGDRGQLAGVVSDRDLGGEHGAETRRGRAVRELMTPSPATATPRTTLRQAANLMRGRLIGSLPVVEDDRVVGIVTATDVLDELGRGATRPTVRAQRQSMRVPPASARRAEAKQRAKQGKARQKRTARAHVDDDPHPVAGRNNPGLGRERLRLVDSPARGPMAAPVEIQRSLQATTRRGRARKTPSEIPAFIRAVGAPIDPDDRAYLRRKLGRKLGKFASSVERVSVRVDDINGPRGGVDMACQIKVTLSGSPSIVVESRDSSLQAAMDGALARAEQMVRNSLRRQRMKPRAAARHGTRERRRGQE